MRCFILTNILFLFLLLRGDGINGGEDEEFDNVDVDDEQTAPSNDEQIAAIEAQDFVTPDPQGNYYFADGFKDQSGIGKKWYLSQAKKDGVDENIAKYNGEWVIDQPEKVVLKNDYGLIIKTRARHHAIAAKLDKPFEFGSKPFIMQYDVLFQNGQECGGAYVKLLTHTKNFDPKQFNDKSPYTIMFGPDKCGLSSKLHFIVRYKNPKNGTINEHHAKQADKSLDGYFTDKKSHLFTLSVNPDGSYRTYIDQKEVFRGNLAENLEPTIVPPKVIEDPNDEKPKDWDEREKIPDPEATKPDDWDESAPETVEDTNAKMPGDWLEDETEYIPDEKAVKPDDWDDEMDGKWEAPLVKNSKCEGISGCGKWTPPKIKNPAYKGKWKAPMISNPGYKGKWKPRTIDNPDYFEDSNPFANLESIGAIGLELWTMSDGIVFDNFIITDDKKVADSFASATWAVKQVAESIAEKSSFFGSLVQAANDRPWLWAVYLLVVLIPIVLITVFCFGGSKDDDAARAKKMDESRPDVMEDEDDALRDNESPKSKTSNTTKGDLEEDESDQGGNSGEEGGDVSVEEGGQEEEEEPEVEEEKPKPSSPPKRRNVRKVD